MGPKWEENEMKFSEEKWNRKTKRKTKQSDKCLYVEIIKSKYGVSKRDIHGEKTIRECRHLCHSSRFSHHHQHRWVFRVCFVCMHANLVYWNFFVRCLRFLNHADGFACTIIYRHTHARAQASNSNEQRYLAMHHSRFNTQLGRNILRWIEIERVQNFKIFVNDVVQ